MRGLQERRPVTALRRGRPEGARRRPSRLAVLGLVAAAVVLVDQVSKSVVVHRLAHGPHHVLGPLDLELSYNSGAAFGLGRGLAPLIIPVGAFLVIALFGFGHPVRSPLVTGGSGLLAGGALSNLGDRLFRSNGGAVIDWIHLSHWPTFNVADSCIVVGVGLLILANVVQPRSSTPAG